MSKITKAERDALDTDALQVDYADSIGKAEAAQMVRGFVSCGDDVPESITEALAVAAIDLSRAEASGNNPVVVSRLMALMDCLDKYRSIFLAREC